MSRHDNDHVSYPFVKTDGGRSQSKRSRSKIDRGDCTVRAVAIACGITYDEAIDALNPDGSGTSIADGQFLFNHIMSNRTINGWRFEWVGFPAVKGQPRMNPPTFSKQFPIGRFICSEAHHVVACIDGVRYDTKPTYPRRCIYGAWQLVGEAEGDRRARAMTPSS
jgi:hypothetical protein